MSKILAVIAVVAALFTGAAYVGLHAHDNEPFFVTEDADCWRECVLAATKAGDSFGSSTVRFKADFCAQHTCRGHWEKRPPRKGF